MSRSWFAAVLFLGALSGCCQCMQDKGLYVTGYGHADTMEMASYNALDNAQHKRFAGGMLNCAMVEDKLLSTKQSEVGYEVVMRYRLIPMRPAWENPPIEMVPETQK